MGDIVQFAFKRPPAGSIALTTLREAVKVWSYLNDAKWQDWCARRGVACEWVRDDTEKVIGLNVQKGHWALTVHYLGEGE